VPEHLSTAAARTEAPEEARTGVRFGLHVSAFPWDDLAGGLREVATGAEAAGFDSIWVMDHVRQIPQVGRDWDPMLETYTALAWLAAATTSLRLGALVTPVTFRNVGLLAKTIATLDVLSGGRATCGLGLGWYEREHEGYGWDLPPVGERYDLLEDALEALPKLWGPGSKPYEGRRLQVPDTTCYPRPLQEHVPLLLGGGGERRTLRLAARHADAINVMGNADVVRHKVEVLHQHLEAEQRSPDAVTVTHLAPTLVAGDGRDLHALVERLRPRRTAPDAYRRQVNAGTVDDQVDRVHELADAGVDEVIVSLPDLGEGDGSALEHWAKVIAAVSER
jgi:F420-dependent oxidoreductase-like protein